MIEMIELRDITFSYGEKKIFDAFSLSISPPASITGPSGCGKTTLLRLIAGMEKPLSGTITGVPERVAFMFQEDRLLPWATAKENVAYALPPNRRDEALTWLDAVELGDKADSLPEALSGGQMRRVALARALAFGAELLILDEPFKGFDPELTVRMVSLIHSVNIPVIASIHSPEEIAVFGGNNIRLQTTNKY